MTNEEKPVILSKLSDEGGGTEERKAIIAKRVAGGKGEKILKKDEKSS